MPPAYAGGDDGNCSNLLEMTESVRRVVLDGDLPEGERFAIAAADIAGLNDALVRSEGFVEVAAGDVLGQDAVVYSKPGYVPGDDCVDIAFLDDGASGRYLLAVQTPDDGPACPALVDIAAATLKFLDGTEA